MKNKCTKNIFKSIVFSTFLVLLISVYAFADIDDANPLNVKKTVVGVLEGQTKYVEPDEEITYRIYISNYDNDFRATGVTIVDYLPEQLSFVKADYDLELGYYDDDTHTYRWSYVPLNSGDSTSINLTAKVKPNVGPGTVITNTVTINSDQTPEGSSSVDVKTPGTINQFNLSKTVVGATDEILRVGLGEQVTYRICFDGNNITAPVTNIFVTDFLPQEVSFIKADDDGIIGHYDPVTHTYTWTYPYISPGQVVCEELTVSVNEDTTVGKVITNLATLEAGGITTATETADIIAESSGIHVEDFQFDPGIIMRDNVPIDVTARMKLPEGFDIDDVSSELLILSPGQVKAKEQHVNKTDGRVVITAVFDKASLLEALPGYGQFNVEITGTLTSGQIFTGQALMTIAADEHISDYISNLNIKMNKIWDYNDQTNDTDLMYEFLLEIEAAIDPNFADFNIESYIKDIEFLTPAEKTYRIPLLPGQWSGNVWRSFKYDSENHLARWEYLVSSENLNDLTAYGDGTYLITVNYLNNDQDQIPVLFGVPGTQDPMMQPTQEPVLTFPEYGQDVASPLILIWGTATDKNITQIRIHVGEDRSGESKAGVVDKDRSRWGPVYLTDGLWKTELAFGQWFSSHGYRISIEVGKYSLGRSQFFVTGQPSSMYEVWGGEKFVGLESGTYVGGGYRDIDIIKANGYVKLGESRSQPATFTGEHKYYLIATRGQFLLDSIQGPNDTYYPYFKESFELYNVTQPDNLLGPPDGRCSLIGVSTPWYDFSGYFAFTNPGDWTGITVTAQNLNLLKTIVGTTDGIKNVDPNDTITYKISIDSNYLIKNVTNVTITDILPEQVSFVSAKNNGVSGKYDPEKHTYTWSLPSMAPQTAIEMEIIVQVNPDIAQGTTITNFVFINSNEMPPTTSSIEVVTRQDQPPLGDIEGQMQIVPQIIRRNGAQVNFKAVVQIPDISVNDISDELVTLVVLSTDYVGSSIVEKSRYARNTSDGTTLNVWFGVDELISAVPGYYGNVTVAVLGSLTSGQSFFANAEVTIGRFAGN
jgi:uncharacterized repeat protein (TIGR01451 family)/fimbrial isopeptide formation D2 family protein